MPPKQGPAPPTSPKFVMLPPEEYRPAPASAAPPGEPGEPGQQEESLVPMAMVFSHGANMGFLSSSPAICPTHCVNQYHNITQRASVTSIAFLKVDAEKEGGAEQLLPLMLLCYEGQRRANLLTGFAPGSCSDSASDSGSRSGSSNPNADARAAPPGEQKGLVSFKVLTVWLPGRLFEAAVLNQTITVRSEPFLQFYETTATLKLDEVKWTLKEFFLKLKAEPLSSVAAQTLQQRTDDLRESKKRRLDLQMRRDRLVASLSCLQDRLSGLQ